jgi:sulfite exporter TauE/SafE
MAYVLLFFAGLAGSLHCVGMCGMFPWSLAAHAPDRPWARQLAYNLGRLNTLVFVGALSGALGAAIVATIPFQRVERVLALLTGCFMTVVALEMLGVMRSVTGRLTASFQRTLLSFLRGTMQSRSWAAPVAVGVFNAFLPCHLIYAFAAHAAATASMVAGALSMLAFGLGTLPAMLAVGIARSLFPHRTWARLSTMSALLVLAFGLLTIVRGLGWLSNPHAHHTIH